MAVEPRRIALSDPLRSSPPRFVVGGQVSQVTSGDIKMYEWRRDKEEMGMVGIQTDIGQIRAMAWSPSPSYRNLLATGLSNGRTVIYNVAPSTLALPLTPNNPATVVASLTIKHTRPVTSISFSSLDANYIATGLERHRSDYSLLIWDISDAVAASGISVDGDDQWRRPEGDNAELSVSNPSAKVKTVVSEPRAIQQYCPSEQVNSVSFVPRTTQHLLASSSNKTIRLFDLRTPSYTTGTNAAAGAGAGTGTGANSPREPHGGASMAGASSQWLTRAVHDITPNPDDTNIFASYEITPGTANSVVKLWDVRRVGYEVLSFDVPGGGVMGLKWTEKGDKLGVGTKEGGVGLWEVINGRRMEDEKVVEEWMTLGGMRQIVKPRPNLHSFAFASGKGGDGDVMFVLKDGTIGIGPIGSAPVVRSGPRGDIAVATPSIRILDPDVPLEKAQGETTHDQEHTRPPTPTEHVPDDFDASHRANRFQLAPERVAKLIAERSRSASPAPGAKATSANAMMRSFMGGERKWYEEGANAERLVDEREELIGGWEGWRRVLGSDVGVVMRRRAMEGYGLSDLLLNAAVATRHPGKERIAGIWEFIDHLTRSMSPAISNSRGYNLTHLGIFPIWTGAGVVDTVEPSSPTSVRSGSTLVDPPNPYRAHEPVRQGSAAWNALSQVPFPHSRHSTTSTPGNDTPPRSRKASERRGQSQELDIDPDYLSAVHNLNQHRSELGGVGKPGVVPAALGGHRTELRKLILSICGENGEGGKEEVERLGATGQRTKAAFKAYFAGDEAGTVSNLMASEDQHHRLLGATIAGFMAQSASARGSEFFNSHWQRLVTKVDEPFIRAILTRIGGEDWEEVLGEEGVPLLDRIAVGVHHMDDREFESFLRRRMNRCTRSNSLHLLALTGFSSPAVSLLSRHLARTGDLQTVAILSAFFPQHRLSKSERDTVERWREDYRDMLDSWGMWGERCEYDVKWGEVARHISGAGAHTSGHGHADGKGGSCPVCNNPLSKDTEERLHRKNAVRGTINVGWPSERTTVCMYCQAPLPRCVICLTHVDPHHPPPSDNDYVGHVTDTIDAAYVCCLTCRHGAY
nr:uncharacterized protein CI109_007324 [Kwoniella shandongensis]KAA5524341.1 hypothetical protein CI109_007324 [Kwoniella shandongensis]